jgi:UDPglucose--hexose-1-phosphate uridylyltransferase
VAWRWHLEILPRLSPLAGFELGTGCHITTLGPVEAARLLAGP